MKISELIGRDNVDLHKLSELLAEGIDSDECKEKICKNVYTEIYNGHLDKRECETLINSLHEGDKRGSIWNQDETNTIAKKLNYDFDEKCYTPEEFRTAMHIMYYDVYFPLKEADISIESTAWGRIGDFYFTGDDEEDGKLVNYFFHKCGCE